MQSFKLSGMKHIVFLFLAAILLTNGNLLGNNEVVSVLATDKKKPLIVEDHIYMDMEINGVVQLYSVLKEEIELIDTELLSNGLEKEAKDWTLANNRDYFIGYDNVNVEAITPSNFKRIAKKYFSDLPELSGIIGKKGFRYKNLPTIILFYNKRITKQGALTKQDKLSVKEIMPR